MLAWFAFSLVLSAALIFVVHGLYRYFIQALTCPIEKDLAETAFDEYKSMYQDMMSRQASPACVRAEQALAADSPPFGSTRPPAGDAAGPPPNALEHDPAMEPVDPAMEPYIRNMQHTYSNQPVDPLQSRAGPPKAHNEALASGGAAREPLPATLDAGKGTVGMMSELHEFIQTNRQLVAPREDPLSYRLPN